MVKRTPSFANYKGPLSSKALIEEPAENAPLLHMVENSHAYEIEIDVPGLGKNFLILVEKGTLAISSENLPGREQAPHGSSSLHGKIKLVIARESEEKAPAAQYIEPEVPDQHFTVL